MELNMPLVSVIVPSYNHAKFVEQTILSIVNQTYKNIELFVVDDGSKDNSQALIKALSDKYKFTFLTQQNGGIHSVFNNTIPRCSGKYIASVASDDVWLLDKIEKQVKYMEQHPEAGAVFGNSLSVNDSGEIIPFYFQRFVGYKQYGFDDVLGLRAHLAAPSNMFRKEVFDKIGTYDNAYPIEDLYMNLKITYNGYKIALLPDLLCYYRVHAGNISKRARYMYEQKLRTLAIYKKEEGYTKAVIKTHLHYYMHVLLGFIPQALLPFKRN